MSNRGSHTAAVAAIAAALSDESRLRAVVMLGDGELCVCQIIDALRLAPSTVSRHMAVLHAAGLVERRKEGKWHYYRLAGRDAAPAVRAALRWVHGVLDEVTLGEGDGCCDGVRDREEAAACYRN